MTEGRFMVAVGAVIEHAPTGRILLLQRSHNADYMPGLWEIPSGRMKQFEELEDALAREIYEETGLRGVEIVKPLSAEHFFRGERTAEKEIVLIMYWVRVQDDAVTISDESEAYRWATPEEAAGIVQFESIEGFIQMFIKERDCAKMG